MLLRKLNVMLRQAPILNFHLQLQQKHLSRLLSILGENLGCHHLLVLAHFL